MPDAPRQRSAGRHAPGRGAAGPAEAGRAAADRAAGVAGALPAPVAVIDIGSNTARVVVFLPEPQGTFQVIADDKVPLRLIREIDARGRLPAAACERILRVLRDFRQIAAGAGARRGIAVATAALREARNGPELLSRIRRETRFSVRLLDPQAEARCAFFGAVYGMTAEHGLVLDIGGGSLQLAHFRDRVLQRSWSLPLGALRMSDRFLRGSAGGKKGARRLAAAASAGLAQAGIPELRDDEVLIGTGGTIRNLGKIDTRRHGHPIARLHGYVLTAGRVRGLNELLERRSGARLPAIRGLNAARTDSIAGGGLLVETVMERVGARRLLVAGLGLREGLLLEALGLDLPAPAAVRASSVRALVSRFSCWDARRAARRRHLVEQLGAALSFGANAFALEMTLVAATVLDIGRNVEYYRRHEHAAMILRSAGLNGFGHREVLYLSLIIEVSERIEWRERTFKPLLKDSDLDEITRSAIILALADRIEHRIPIARAPRMTVRAGPRTVTISEAALSSWDPPEVAAAFERWFSKRLRIRAGR